MAVSWFLQIYVVYCCKKKKNWSVDFPEKQAPAKAKCLQYYHSAKLYGISPKETQEVHCQFCFLGPC